MQSRRTKIVATVGPASETPDELDALIEAGVDVFRLNLSHGSLASHIERLTSIRAAEKRAGRPIAVLADLPGPKVRAGQFPDGGVLLPTGSLVRLVPDVAISTADVIGVDYSALLADLRSGDRLVVGDGAISMRVTEMTSTAAIATVVTGGKVQGRPGIHLPTTNCPLDTPTPEDLVLAEAMAAAGADFIAVSFVRSGGDMRQVRDRVGVKGPRLVAKIETREAVDNLRDIVSNSDVIMVARGDLGIDCELADVPHLQKRIIRTCVEVGTPVITATQMLESMITAPTPTRAEVSDVANAVFDGTDAVMLSGETAIGVDPSLVVSTMAAICKRAESEASYRQWATRLGREQRRYTSGRGERVTGAVTHAAWQAAEDVGAQLIVCCTRSGNTARAVARFRPIAKLAGVSPDSGTARSLCVSWGVTPLVIDVHSTVDDMVWFSVEAAVKAGLALSGEIAVVLAGTPESPHSATDLLRVIEIS